LTSAPDGGERSASRAGVKSPWYLWDRRLGGPQSRSGRAGEEKNSQPLPVFNLSIIQPIAQRYTTQLSRLIVAHVAADVTPGEESPIPLTWEDGYL